MSSFGVIPTGFGQKLFEDIKSEIEQSQIDSISAGLNHSTQSILSRLNVIYGDKAAELWEVATSVYNSIDPNAATGAALDALSAITGAARLPAAPSTTSLDFTATSAVSVPAGTVVSALGSPDVRFSTDVELTFVAAGTLSVAATATVTGPTDAAIGALSVLETPIAQISSVTNPAKPDLGRDLETDTELRARRIELLSLIGGSTVDAIRADVSSVENVDEVVVFENDTDVTDPDGIPPHAFEVVVRGGLDDGIAQAIWDTKPAGIQSYSSTSDSGTAVDLVGRSHVVPFSRPVDVPIYVNISVTTDPLSYAGDLAVQEAIRDSFLSLRIGDDVIISQLCVPVFGVSGVLDITLTQIGTAPAPTGTVNIPIDPRALAIINDHLTDIVVTSI